MGEKPHLKKKLGLARVVQVIGRSTGFGRVAASTDLLVNLD
jgi:hypothetical protein